MVVLSMPALSHMHICTHESLPDWLEGHPTAILTLWGQAQFEGVPRDKLQVVELQAVSESEYFNWCVANLLAIPTLQCFRIILSPKADLGSADYLSEDFGLWGVLQGSSAAEKEDKALLGLPSAADHSHATCP